MADFRDLGLREELLNALLDGDIIRPTAIQHGVIPVLRRGGNLVARAASGAGKTLAYTLGVLDHVQAGEEEREEEAPRARVLVLRPTTGSAEVTAVAVFPYAQATGHTVSVAGGSWGTPAEAAGVVVGTPAGVLGQVRSSNLKLDGIQAVVIDGASTIHELGELEPLETLLDHVPRDAQRVLLTAAFPAEITELIDRRVKRALRYPSEAAVPEQHPAPTEGSIGYVLVPEAQKLELLARALSGRSVGGTPPILFFRTDERAAVVAEQLTVRGFVIGELGDAEADVVVATVGVSRAELGEEAEVAPDQTISYDVPADEDTLLERHAGDGNAIVMVEPRELPHLRMIAERARLETRSVTIPIASPAVREVEDFRDRLRNAIRDEDLGAQLLLLEPLLDEYGAAELAAAATALLRRRTPPREEAAAAGTSVRSGQRPDVAGRAGAPRVPAADAGPPPATYARLYIGVGSRDGVRAGDLVGAIAGEANIPGSSIGKIEIRDTFSIAEVPANAADTIIGALNGTTIKGRSARVDYDRAGDRARKPGQRRSAGPDGESRAPRRTPVRRPPRSP
jgi:ATP-dependent RNA helicase DeaD